MKTINPAIEIFKTEEKARKYFSKLAQPAQLLKAYDMFYVDTSKEAIKDWPHLYTLISEK